VRRPAGIISRVGATICGSGIAGVTITIKDGATVVDTIVTGAGGNPPSSTDCHVPAPGFYTVECTILGRFCSAYLEFFLGAGPTMDMWTVTVEGCISGQGLEGATVTMSTFADQLTDADGKAYFFLPFGTGPGFFDWSVSHPRFLPYSDSSSNPGCFTVPPLTPADGYWCAAVDGSICCNLPIPDTISGNDSVLGSQSMTYDTFTGKWHGQKTINIAACGHDPAKTGVIVMYDWPASSGCEVGVSVSLDGFTTLVLPQVSHTSSCDPLAASTIFNQCNCSTNVGGCSGRQIWPGTGTTTVSVTE
jgi:hypothetical protein